MSPPRHRTVRVRGLPMNDEQATLILGRVATAGHQGSLRHALFPTCDRNNELTGFLDLDEEQMSGLAISEDPSASLGCTIDGHEVTVDRNFGGFTQLSMPAGKVRADVVAIGGIGGHAYGSWQHRGSDRMWLRHWLPRDFPDCRIMIYGYRGELVKELTATVDDYAREFLEGLKRIRNTQCRQKPIIFVAHSFGGIILSRALIRARNAARQDPELDSLLRDLLGVMFFAVPHRGLDVEDMVRIMGTENHPRTGLIQTLNTDFDKLESNLEELKNLLYYCKVVSFYETEQSRRLQRSKSGEWRRTGEPLKSLTRESAVLQLPSQIETAIPLHRDHSSIVKFESRHDAGYEHVCEHIGIFLSGIPKPDDRDIVEEIRPAPLIDVQKPAAWIVIAALGIVCIGALFGQRPKSR